MKTIKVNGKTYQKTIVFGNRSKKTVFDNVKKKDNKLQCRKKGNKDGNVQYQ